MAEIGIGEQVVTVYEPHHAMVAWKPAKRRAAGYLAIGCTVAYTARQTRTPPRTLYNWLDEDEFQRGVISLKETAWQRAEPEIFANLGLALEVQRAMFRGEVQATDERYLAAERLIDRFLGRLLYVEPANVASGNGSVGAAIQLNVNAAPAGHTSD